MGFPDIQTLQPLAQALEVSLLELMQSREIPEETVSNAEANAAVADALTFPGAKRLSQVLRWIEHGFAAIVILTMVFLAVMLNTYVTEARALAVSQVALALLFLCTSAVYILRRAAEAPKRPTSHQILRWVTNAMALACLMSGFMLKNRQIGNEIALVGIITLCIRNLLPISRKGRD